MGRINFFCRNSYWESSKIKSETAFYKYKASVRVSGKQKQDAAWKKIKIIHTSDKALKKCEKETNNLVH